MVRLDIVAPLDIAVSRIGEIPHLYDEQHILSGDDVDDRFQRCADIPCDPLFSESEEDEQTDVDAHC